MFWQSVNEIPIGILEEINEKIDEEDRPFAIMSFSTKFPLVANDRDLLWVIRESGQLNCIETFFSVECFDVRS